MQILDSYVRDIQILNFYPRTAAHCFCVDVGMIERKHKYCYKELAEGPHIIKYVLYFTLIILSLRGVNKFYIRIYLGMVKGNEFDNTVEMKIDTVITPAERIRMYQEKFTVLGSSDIALVRTSNPILFIPNQVSPVQLNWMIIKVLSDLNFKDLFEQSAGGRTRRVRDGIRIRRRRGH